MKKKILELLEILLGNILVAAAFGLIILPLHFVAPFNPDFHFKGTALQR